MSIDTTFLHRCVSSLERAVEEIGQFDDSEEIRNAIYGATWVKELAETTLILLPAFMEDAKALANIIELSGDG